VERRVLRLGVSIVSSALVLIGLAVRDGKDRVPAGLLAY
jgi:hypothetical protein